MTLREKIGQMVMLGFKGYEPDNDIRTLIKDYKLGNVIYFKRNVKTAEQVYDQNKTLQSLSTHPMLIGIDQEGGLVTAIDDIVPIPGAMASSAAGDADLYRRTCEAGGRAMRSLGINMNFAPVTDINNNPKNPVINARSYGDTVETVNLFSTAAIQGYEQAGILSTAKHFPGHGDTDVDSHLGLPLSELSEARFDNFELAPFKNAIAEGVPSIMTAHILLKSFDEENPATLSKPVMTGLLRETLEFEGILITDLLSMHAIKDHYDLKDTIRLGVNAGNDILLYDAYTLEDNIRFLDTFKRLVDEGKIAMKTLDESVERILAYKDRYRVGSLSESFKDIEPLLNPADALRDSATLTERSLTLARNEGHLPIDYGKTLIIFPDVSIYSLVDNYTEDKETFGSFLKRQGFKATEMMLKDEWDDENRAELIKHTQSYATILVFTHNATLSPQQETFIRNIDPNKLVLVSLRAPYDAFIAEGGTSICAYEATPHAFKAIDKLLRGRIEAKGTLPVSIPKKACSNADGL